MAIQKPYVLSWAGVTLDGNDANLLTWKTSGAISTSFAISIYKNSDNSLEWSLAQTASYAAQYTIPVAALTNGIEHKLTVTVWDASGSSATSDPVIFQTSSRPVVTLPEIPTVSSPTFTVSASYNQAENSPIRSWIAILYDADQTKLLDSGIQLNSAMSWLIKNLQSGKKYFVEFQVTSEAGLIGTSGKIQFSVTYLSPQIHVNLTAVNTENAGILISGYVVQIIGTAVPADPTYISGEKIDLTESGNKVLFDQGFSTEGDFTVKLWLENPANKQDLLILQGANGSFRLQYWKLDNKFHLIKKLTGNSYTEDYVSESVTSGKYFVSFQQADNWVSISASEDI